jgi:hypothetical protein
MNDNIQNKILLFLNKIEKDIPVNNWKIGSRNIWPLVRITMAFDLFLVEDFNENNQITKYRGFYSKFLKVLQTAFLGVLNYFKDFSKNDFSNSKIDVMYLINSSTRYYKLNEKWYNPFSDPFYSILDRENIKQRVVELTSDYQYRIPRYRKSKFIQIDFFIIQFKALILSKYRKIDFKKFEGMDILNAKLAATFSKYKKIDQNYFNSRIIAFELYRKYYLNQLKKWKPKVIICHGFYSPDVLALISSANELNIKTIEIQHGVQGKYHLAYSNWNNIPKEGYELFPNVFWTWTESEKRNIDTWILNNDKHKVIVGSNPGLFILDENCNDTSIEIANSIKSILKLKPAHKNVIFTVQAFFELPQFLIDVIKNNKDWNWWLRVHPQYSETKKPLIEKFEYLKCTNVLIEEASNYPLTELLKFMDLHITEFSSSVIEAKSLGVNSVVINDKGKNLYSEFIEQGDVRFADNVADLQIAIESLTSNKATDTNIEFEKFKNAIQSEIVDVVKSHAKK